MTDVLSHVTQVASWGSSALGPGVVIGDHYRVVRLLGRGGMGEVYEVEDTAAANGDDSPRLALKTTRSDRVADGTFRRRFLRECQVVQQLEHPSIARLLDYGVDGAVPFFTMELLHGETLAERLARAGRLSPGESQPIIAAVASALDHSHRAGIVHRDVKPSNIFLAGERILLTDFGVARQTASTQTALTETSQVVGTLAYAAPEQVMGGEVTPANDVFALGVTAFEMLTGQLPFSGSSPVAQATARLTTAPLRLREVRPDLPAALEDLVAAMLSREPAGRPASAGAVASAFADACEGRTSFTFGRAVRRTRRRAVPIAAAAAGVAVLAGAGAFLLRHQAKPAAGESGAEFVAAHRIRQISAMKVARDGHTVTVLASGLALVAGGKTDSTHFTSSAEVFDPATGAFRAVGDMVLARSAHTATWLGRSQVLIAGGTVADGVTDRCEVFDVETGAFAETAKLAVPRNAHGASILPDGSVLVSGGGYGQKKAIDSTEIFDAGTSTFRPGSSMLEPRLFHASIGLEDGRVLIAGGWGGRGDRGHLLASAEFYEPRTRRFMRAGSMRSLRYAPSATLLLDGRVLFAGGYSPTNVPMQTAEIFDPATGVFRPVGSMARCRIFHAAILTASGLVVVAGGENPASGLQSLAEVFDPVAERFVPFAALVGHRWGLAGVLLLDGRILLTGGRDGTFYPTAELVEDLGR